MTKKEQKGTQPNKGTKTAQTERPGPHKNGHRTENEQAPFPKASEREENASGGRPCAKAQESALPNGKREEGVDSNRVRAVSVE